MEGLSADVQARLQAALQMEDKMKEQQNQEIRDHIAQVTQAQQIAQEKETELHAQFQLFLKETQSKKTDQSEAMIGIEANLKRSSGSLENQNQKKQIRDASDL